MGTGDAGPEHGPEDGILEGHQTPPGHGDGERVGRETVRGLA